MSVKLKISCCSGEAGVPAAPTPSNDGGIHPIKARRGLSSQSGHVCALIHISDFPQPQRQHVNRANRRHAAPFGNGSHFKYNMRNSRVEIHILAKTTAGGIAAAAAGARLLGGDV